MSVDSSRSDPSRGAPGPGAFPSGSISRAPRGSSGKIASSAPRSTLALLFVSVLLPLVLFGLAAWQNRRDVVRAAEHRVERTTLILHEHAMKVFETHQLVLDQINERLPWIDWSNPKDVESLHDLLAHLRQLLPQVANIIVTDADGRLRADSIGFPSDPAIDFSDRESFKALKLAAQPIPYISRAIEGKQVKTPIFTMSTRARGKDPKAFDGIISIAIQRSYFSAFYSDLEREYAHVVMLVRSDGAVLSSEPALTSLQLPADTVARLALGRLDADPMVQPAVIDGTKHLLGYERVGNYPVFIGFGISWDSALAPWLRNIRGYGLVAGLSSLMLLGVSGFAIRRITLEGRATMRWRRSAARLEAEIAERGRIEEQLRQSQKMEAVGRLTGGVAHDFNNLLTVVIGSLDLLSRRMKDADPRLRGLISNATDGASRAAALTSRLLAFSRQHPLDPKPIDANALINGMLNLLQRTLGETVTIDLRLAGDLWQTFADPNQLENAVLNLCVNAVDAMPKGGTLTLATANATLDEAFCASRDEVTAGSYVRISVTDTGTGMAPNVLAKAFDPFFTTKPVGKGTGLGLSQVYGFARQTGGHAEISSEVGKGSTIDIYLPRRKVAAALVAPPASPVAVPSLEPLAEISAVTILIVEDDDLVRQFSSTVLREAGHLVLEAATGPDGLHLIETHPDIALLFTDVVLKGPMNGRELADRALARRPHLPVLFTTGYTKDAIMHHGRIDEGTHLISKPFTASALAAKISDLLAGHVVETRRAAVG